MPGFLYYRKSDGKLMGNSGYPVKQIPYEAEEPIQVPRIDLETGEQAIDPETGELLFGTKMQIITYRRDFTGEDGIAADVIPNFGGVLADYGSLELTDEQMAECYAAASYVVNFDGETPTGTTNYAWAQLACPRTATVGIPVDISISAEGGDGVQAIIYIDDVEQARANMPITDQIQFNAAGTYLVEVDAGRHGKLRQEVVAL